MNSEYSSKTVNNNLQVGFVGRIDIKTKGLDILLEGLRKFIYAYGPIIELNIVGDGKDMKLLKKLIQEKKLENCVNLKGALYGDDKFNEIKRWDYLCLTSRNEGMPGAVLEALGTGVPCIVSNATNMGRYIDQAQAGFRLKHNNPKSIERTLFEAFENKHSGHYSRLSKNAIKLIQSEFNWNTISDRLISNT